MARKNTKFALQYNKNNPIKKMNKKNNTRNTNSMKMLLLYFDKIIAGSQIAFRANNFERVRD